MAEKDSIRFLASQLNGLGDRIRQDAQSNASNALQQRYMQLAQSKFGQEQKIQGQQTAIGALDAMATNKAVEMMDAAHDTDVTHLPIFKERAKRMLMENTETAGKFANLPPEMKSGQTFTPNYGPPNIDIGLPPKPQSSLPNPQPNLGMAAMGPAYGVYQGYKILKSMMGGN